MRHKKIVVHTRPDAIVVRDAESHRQVRRFSRGSYHSVDEMREHARLWLMSRGYVSEGLYEPNRP